MDEPQIPADQLRQVERYRKDARAVHTRLGVIAAIKGPDDLNGVAENFADLFVLQAAAGAMGNSSEAVKTVLQLAFLLGERHGKKG